MNGNSDLFDTEEYQDFKEVLARVSSVNKYTEEEHNNIINFLSKSLDTDTALYVIELLSEFFIGGYELGLIPQ